MEAHEWLSGDGVSTQSSSPQGGSGSSSFSEIFLTHQEPMPGWKSGFGKGVFMKLWDRVPDTGENEPQDREL